MDDAEYSGGVEYSLDQSKHILRTLYTSFKNMVLTTLWHSITLSADVEKPGL